MTFVFYWLKIKTTTSRALNLNDNKCGYDDLCRCLVCLVELGGSLAHDSVLVERKLRLSALESASESHVGLLDELALGMDRTQLSVLERLDQVLLCRFLERFGRVEAALGGDLTGRSLAELEALWRQAKAAIRAEAQGA